MNQQESNNKSLIAEFVSTFERLDELLNTDVPVELAVATDGWGWKQWRPLPVDTLRSVLSDFYTALGLSGIESTRLPHRHEQLILSYRWAEVDLGYYRLLANLPGPDLSGFAHLF